MNYNSDTIAAIATAPGEAGIAVVRVSGAASLEIAGKLVDCKGPIPSERQSPALVHGIFRGQEREIDEVLLLIMRKPKSYTKEDVIEIQCHGGHVVSRSILRCILSEGARLAEPGEFTARAFMNGRMDLVQAEAVADLIHAQSDKAAATALEQLQGELSKELDGIYDGIIELASNIETSLDFAEQNIDPLPPEISQEQLNGIRSRTTALLDTHDEGRLLRQGARVVISGRPNVGKSTLLNKLLESERAIVSHIPGTTRDTIEERIVLDGFPVVLTDTAGLRETKCAIEEEGIRRTKAQIEQANLHIYIIDASQKLSPEDKKFLAARDPKNSLVVKNKIDIAKSQNTDIQGITQIYASLVNGEGVDAIRASIRDKIEENLDFADHTRPAIAERHYRTLLRTREELDHAANLFDQRPPGYEVLIVSHLRSAGEQIGELLGKCYNDELLNNIFTNFCIGK